MEKKIAKAFQYAPIADATKKQILSQFSVSALATAAVVFTALQFTPAGWALDTALIVIAVAVYGTAAFSIGSHLGRFFRMCQEAGNEDQLKQAGGELAQAVAIAGGLALGSIIGRAISLKGKGNTKPDQPSPTKGLEERGYKPQEGERTQTRRQYQNDPTVQGSSISRLNNLLGPDTVRQLQGKLSQKQIEAFIKEIGITETRRVVSKFGPDAMAFYNPRVFKNFRGVTNSTMRHLSVNDGIQGGAIKGCHDKALFLNELTVIGRPMITGGTHPLGRILTTRIHPRNPKIVQYSYKIFSRNSAGQIQSPPTLLGGNPKDKTVIDGLISNGSYWQNVGQLAIIRAIRTKTYDPASRSFTTTVYDMKISGFFSNGEVASFFPIW